MESAGMELRIFLPFRVFAEIKNVVRIVAENSEGSFGMLPQRLDCVAALSAGIFTYETKTDGVHYVAIDEGIMVKAGLVVLVSVRNAFGRADLGKLRELVENEFIHQDKQEKEVRSVVAKLESGFMYNWEKFREEA